MLKKEVVNQFPWREAYAALVVGVPNLLLGLSITFTAYVMAGVNGIDKLQETLDGSISILTAVFGSILFASLTDSLGRKRSIQLICFFYGSGVVIVYFSGTSNTMFYISRVLSGLAMGGRPTTTLYMSEVCNKNRRGRYNSFHGFLTVFGAMLTYLLQYLFTVKILACICCTISCLGFVGTFFLPESRYFYIVKGEKEKAIQSARWYDQTKRAEDIESEISEIEAQKSSGKKESILNVLKQVSHLKNMAIAFLVFFARTFCGREPISVYPGNFLSQLHTIYDVRIIIILQSVFEIIICVLSTIFMDKCNRRTWLYFVGSVGILSAGGLILCQFFINFVNSTIPWMIAALYFTYVSVISGILFPLAALVACEIVSKSNEYRNILFTFTWTANNLIRSLYTAAFPTLINDFPINYTLLVFVCSNLLLIFVTKFLVVETANKSLHKCIPDEETDKEEKN